MKTVFNKLGTAISMTVTSILWSGCFDVELQGLRLLMTESDEDCFLAESYDYKRDIEPMFSRSCLNCHSAASGNVMGNVSFSNFATSESAKENRAFFERVYLEVAVKRSMPPRGTRIDRLSSCEVKKLRAWIDQPNDVQIPMGIAISSPASGSRHNRFVDLVGTCTGDGAVLFSGDIVLPAPQNISCLNNAFTARVELSAGQGRKDVSIRIQSGLQSESVSVFYINDTIAPTLAFSAPAANQRFQSVVHVVASCEDSLPVLFSGDVVALATPAVCTGGTIAQDITLSNNTAAGSEQNKTITIRQVDQAGNATAQSVVVVRDNRAPALAIANPAANSVQGVSVALSGACESGINVTFSGTGHSSPPNTTCISGAFSATVVFTAGNGTKNIVATQTDSAGNSASVNRDFSRSVAGPNLAVTSPAPGTLTNTAISLSGQCEGTLPVQITGQITQNRTVNCNNGSIPATSISFTAAPAGDQNRTVTLSTTRADGVSTTISVVYLFDTAAPAVDIDTPIAGDASQSDMLLSGDCESAEPSPTVTSGVTGIPLTLTCSSNRFSRTVTLASGSGEDRTITVSQTDRAGNTATDTVAVRRDVTPPAIQIQSPTNNSYQVGQFTLTGACQNSLQISLSGDVQNAGGTGVNCSGGQFSVQVTLSSGDTTKTVTVSQTDSAGNRGSASLSVIRDSTAPQVAVTSPAEFSSWENVVRIQGTCEASLAIRINGVTSGAIEGNTVLGTCSGSGRFDLQVILAGSGGVKALNVVQSDNVGNQTTRSFSLTKQSATTVAGNPFDCSTSVDPSPSPIRRLSKAQLRNTVRSIAIGISDDDGIISFYLQQDLNIVPNDAPQGDTISQLDQRVTQDHADAYFNFIYTTVGRWIGNWGNFSRAYLQGGARNVQAISSMPASGCTSAASGTCLQPFVRNLGLSILRRPLQGSTSDANSEISRYLALVTGNGSSGDHFRNLINVMMNQPEFIYHFEVRGNYASGRNDVVELSAWELASRLSYQFWQDMPDQALFAAAQDGSLITSAGYESQLSRLIASSKANGSIGNFMYDWLDLAHTQTPGAGRSSESYDADIRAAGRQPGGQYTEAWPHAESLRQRMIDEVLDLGRYYFLAAPSSRMEDLFTSNRSFARTPEIATIYRVGVWNGNFSSPGPEFPSSAPRAGVLTRSALLAANSIWSNPVKKGVRVLKKVLCEDPGLPPPNAGVATVEASDFGACLTIHGLHGAPQAQQREMCETEIWTSRRQQTTFTASPACMSCHSVINPLGFGTEDYDSFGRYRNYTSIANLTPPSRYTYVTDQGNVDEWISYDPGGGNRFETLRRTSAATTLELDGQSIQTDSGIEFSQAIADSEQVRACFVRNLYRFSFGKVESDVSDGCSLNRMYGNLSNTSDTARLRNAYRNIANDPDFKRRKLD